MSITQDLKPILNVELTLAHKIIYMRSQAFKLSNFYLDNDVSNIKSSDNSNHLLFISKLFIKLGINRSYWKIDVILMLQRTAL